MTASLGAHPLITFTPSAMPPEVLEAIFVKREALAARIVSSVKASTTSKAKHHWLLVGPRGIGKTHLVALTYHRLVRNTRLRRKLCIAWLREEAWEVSSYLNLLEAILAAVAEEEDEDTRDRIQKDLDRFLDLPSPRAERAAEHLLLEVVGHRTLVLIVENLNEVFRGLQVAGQRALRAFIENTDLCTVLATTPGLFPGVSSHSMPFYGFFTLHHLEELHFDEARELLRRIAQLRGDGDLVAFLETPLAEARLRVVAELAGGHPRIWVLFANCLSIELIDELVPLFLKLLDDLTPYYQERMRSLSAQQRRVVTHLADVGGAQPVKEIARACRLDQRGAAKVLGDLEKRGFVRKAEELDIPTTGDRRLSAYELREPLMRLCLDVKESRGKPLRLIVAFLREWYGPQLFEFAALIQNDSVTQMYIAEAIHSYIDAKPQETIEFMALFISIFVTTILLIPVQIILEELELSTVSKDLAKWLTDQSKTIFQTKSVDFGRLEALLVHAKRSVEEAHGQNQLATAIVVSAMPLVSHKFFAHILSTAVPHVSGTKVEHLIHPEMLQPAAKLWLTLWEHVADDDEYQVPLRILRTAVAWRHDHNRSHLLALPVEERRIFETLVSASRKMKGAKMASLPSPDVIL